MGKKDKGRSKGKGKGKGKGKLRKADRANGPAPSADQPLIVARSPGSIIPSGPRASGQGTPAAGDASRRQGRGAIEATELAARLAGLGTVLRRQLARGDTGDGLTRARLSALALLVLGGPRRLGQLAAAEGVRPPTMTRLVQAMELDGLVTREPDPDDGRSIIIRATASGERRLDEGRVRQLAPLASAIGELGHAERRQLEDAADLLGRLLRDTPRETDADPDPDASWESSEPAG